MGPLPVAKFRRVAVFVGLSLAIKAPPQVLAPAARPSAVSILSGSFALNLAGPLRTVFT